MEMLVLSSCVTGFTGSISTTMFQAAAYIGDITPAESRGKRLMLRACMTE